MEGEREPRVLREAREVAARAARRRTPDGRYAPGPGRNRMSLRVRDRWMLIMAVVVGMIVAFYLLDDVWPRIAASPVARAAGEAVAERAHPAPNRPPAAAHAVPVEDGGADGEGDDDGDGDGGDA